MHEYSHSSYSNEYEYDYRLDIHDIIRRMYDSSLSAKSL